MDLKQEIENYQPNTTMNVTDLKFVTTDMEILDSGELTNNDGEKFSYKYIQISDIKYRIPPVVIGDMKEILKSFPDTTKFKVTRKGAGINTRYAVMKAD